MSPKPRALVLRTAGTNCDQETVWALEVAGARTERVHINELLAGRKHLLDYQILVIPGGFSYGDDIASGKVLANQLYHRLRESLDPFLEKRRPIIGICNGFQVLVKCGLLPGLSGWDQPPRATLTDNDSGRFECRWTHLKVTSRRSIFSHNLPEVFPLPVAHGEGRWLTASPQVDRALDSSGQVIFRYVDPSGGRVGYPWNPNGSSHAVAAVTNPEGYILGMMPHPERFAFPMQHPAWTRQVLQKLDPVGRRIFVNAVRYAGEVS